MRRFDDLKIDREAFGRGHLCRTIRDFAETRPDDKLRSKSEIKRGLRTLEKLALKTTRKEVRVAELVVHDYDDLCAAAYLINTITPLELMTKTKCEATRAVLLELACDISSPSSSCRQKWVCSRFVGSSNK